MDRVVAQRRRVLRTRLVGAAGIVTLGVLGSVGVVRHRSARQVEEARASGVAMMALGTYDDLTRLSEQLGRSPGADDPSAPIGRARRAVDALRAAEFGDSRGVARDGSQPPPAVGASADAWITHAMRKIATGDLVAAAASVEAAEDAVVDDALLARFSTWPALVLELARERSHDGLAPSMTDISVDDAAPVSIQRLQIYLLHRRGQHRAAMRALAKMRTRAATHLGLAADEALLRAAAREQLGAVASLSEQLLSRGPALSPVDRGRASLARAVVHLYSGEREAAARTVRAAWPALPGWDPIARDLALEVAVDAGDRALVNTILDTAGLPARDVAIYRAWSEFGAGDPAGALTRLASLDQRLPRVAYLQGLSLVAQERYAEATPWIARAEAFFPGRVELEVARARIGVHEGDPRASMRTLEGLAQEEPYAPRAWTGLGEARLAVYTREDGVDLRMALDAQAALERAVDVEPLPATAHRRLGALWAARIRDRDDASTRALDNLREAAALNPNVEQNRVALAMMLVDLGLVREGTTLIEALVEDGTTRAPVLLASVQLLAASDAPDAAARAKARLALARQHGAPETALSAAAMIFALTHEPDAVVRDMVREALARGAASSDDPTWLAILGRALASTVDREAGLVLLRRAIRRFDDADVGPLYLEWARIELRQDQFARAGGHALIAYRALRGQNAAPRAQLEAAHLAVRGMARSRRSKAAARLGEALTRRFPMVALSWEIHAFALHAMLASEASLEAIDRALTLDDARPTAHALRSKILLRRGDQIGARRAMRRAVALARGTAEFAGYQEQLEKLK